MSHRGEWGLASQNALFKYCFSRTILEDFQSVFCIWLQFSQPLLDKKTLYTYIMIELYKLVQNPQGQSQEEVMIASDWR